MGMIMVNGVSYGGARTAQEILYDNSGTGMASENVQNAIDKLYELDDNKMNRVNPTGTGSFSMNVNPNSFVGDYAHIEGYNCSATNEASHAEGFETGATGIASHAEGYQSHASGKASHVEGEACEAEDNYSHAEGYDTTAYGIASHTEGYCTETDSDCQHAQGKYNDCDFNYAHMVGNGISETERSNAHTLDWDGNAEFAGDVIAYSCGGENPISISGLNSNKADKLNPTITWKVNVGTDAEQTFELRKSGASPTEGLSIVRRDKDGNQIFGGLFDHTGKFLPDISNKVTALTPVNNLTSTSTTAPLAANQGKVLNGKFASYLPLSGGTLTGKNIYVNNGSGAISISDSASYLIHYSANKDANNLAQLYVANGNALNTKLRFQTVASGTKTTYNVYGTHNITISKNEVELENGAIHLIY